MKIPAEPPPACVRVREEQRGGKLVTATGACVGRARKYRVRIYECVCGGTAFRTVQSNGRVKPGRVTCPRCKQLLKA